MSHMMIHRILTAYTNLTTFAFIFFLKQHIFALFKLLWLFCPDLCRRIWAYTRENNESSTWDSTRLQTVVFVMWSFWSFVSCPATQNAIRNNFCTSCLQPIIFENSMQQNVSSHIATEIAILSQTDFNSRRFNGYNIQKNEDTIFLTNQRAAFCSRAPHCLLSTSPTYT